MKIIECPRDAMQGIQAFIPTSDKIRYINQLLQVGFDTIDFGSFVSPKAVPQMHDTEEVLNNLQESPSKLLAIVANLRGAKAAAVHHTISYLGFPLSISETFQQRNTNKSIAEALNVVAEIQDLCVNSGKKLVTYLSMGFGNPYNDPYDTEIVEQFVDILNTLEVKIISLADTVGVAVALQVNQVFSSIVSRFPGIEFGAHLHARSTDAEGKIAAAYQAGCRRFDGALKGFGGCPMAGDQLVGNIATEQILSFMDSKGIPVGVNRNHLAMAQSMADEIFPKV